MAISILCLATQQVWPEAVLLGHPTLEIHSALPVPHVCPQIIDIP
jgi:hypothetical protein